MEKVSTKISNRFPKDLILLHIRLFKLNVKSSNKTGLDGIVAIYVCIQAYFKKW
jgi:hypothetical protein